MYFIYLAVFPFLADSVLFWVCAGGVLHAHYVGGGQGLGREAICGSELRVRGKEGLGWERGAQAWAADTRLGVTRLSK